MPIAPSEITVIVPTWKRVSSLQICLEALDKQVFPPREVIVCVRPEDEETLAFLARSERPGRLVRPVLCERPGQVYALTRGIDEAQTDLVAITDDDGAPRPEWLQNIVHYFDTDPSIGGVGGRDNVFAQTENDWLRGSEPIVGMVLWSGKTIGFHHFGVGPARFVQTLKGVNMSYRKSALGDLRPDPRLRGKGAQVGNDMALSLQLAARGWKLLYDPEMVQVDHYEGSRPPEEHRNHFNAVAHYDETFNRTLTLYEYLGTQPGAGMRKLAFLGQRFLVGTRKYPGLLLLVHGLLTRRPQTWQRWRGVVSAYIDAIQAAGQPSVKR